MTCAGSRGGGGDGYGTPPAWRGAAPQGPPGSALGGKSDVEGGRGRGAAPGGSPRGSRTPRGGRLSRGGGWRLAGGSPRCNEKGGGVVTGGGGGGGGARTPGCLGAGGPGGLPKRFRGLPGYRGECPGGVPRPHRDAVRVLLADLLALAAALLERVLLLVQELHGRVGTGAGAWAWSGPGPGPGRDRRVRARRTDTAPPPLPGAAPPPPPRQQRSARARHAIGVEATAPRRRGRGRPRLRTRRSARADGVAPARSAQGPRRRRGACARGVLLAALDPPSMRKRRRPPAPINGGCAMGRLAAGEGGGGWNRNGPSPGNGVEPAGERKEPGGGGAEGSAAVPRPSCD